MSLCGCLSHVPTGDLAHNPGMCPDWELNQWDFGSQAHAQSTELHHPRLDLPFDPEIPLLVIYAKQSKTLLQKNINHPYVHCSSIYNHQDMEAAQVAISRWVHKTTWDSYTVEYYFAVKKKKIFPFVTAWMGLENIMLGEISQSEKDKYHMISLICGI